jgi:hypothetical protein
LWLGTALGGLYSAQYLKWIIVEEICLNLFSVYLYLFLKPNLNEGMIIMIFFLFKNNTA